MLLVLAGPIQVAFQVFWNVFLLIFSFFDIYISPRSPLQCHSSEVAIVNDVLNATELDRLRSTGTCAEAVTQEDPVLHASRRYPTRNDYSRLVISYVILFFAPRVQTDALYL